MPPRPRLLLLPLLRHTPWLPPPFHWFGNPRPTRWRPAAGSAGAGAGAGGAVQRRHRAADKQRRHYWHHGCRWRLLLSLSSSAGVCSPSRRRRRPSTTRRSCSTTCSCSSQRRLQRLPAPARSPGGIPTAPAVRWSAPSSNAPRKGRAGLVGSMHSTKRSALGSSIAAEVMVAGKRERERGAGARECSNTRARPRRVDALVRCVIASAGVRCPITPLLCAKP